MSNHGIIERTGIQAVATGLDMTDQLIGSRLLAEGKLKQQDIGRIIKLQEEKNLRFGEAARQLGLVNDADIQKVLAEQFDYDYLSPGQNNLSAELYAAYQPFGHESEVLRKLRTQLQLRWFARGRKGLAVLGPSGDEGVSRLAANLAITFAQGGMKTLLVDANMRTPRQHELFNLGRRTGLSEFLGERCNSAEMVSVPGLNKLSVLCAGAVPPNPAELLNRPRFLDWVRDVYADKDIVLFDCPAAKLAPDFQTVVSGATHGALLVTRKNHSQFSQIQQVKEMVAAVGAEIVGGVINHF